MTSGNRRLRSERKFLVNPLPLPFSPQPSQSIPNRVSSETDIHPFQFAILNKEGALIASALSSFTTETNITRHRGLFMQACTCMHALAATLFIGGTFISNSCKLKDLAGLSRNPSENNKSQIGGRGVAAARPEAPRFEFVNSSIQQFINLPNFFVFT
jgi:hypothetical protein